MPAEAVLDNDILLKCSCYAVLEDIAHGVSATNSLAILGAAKYVVRSRLSRSPEVRDPGSATTRLNGFLGKMMEIEPTAEELALAARIEEAALLANLEVDVGESQLCAVVIQREIPRLITGDKRAVRSLEMLLTRVGELALLKRRVVSLEQLILWLVGGLTAEMIQARVCAEPLVDKAVAISMSCADGGAGPYDPAGLQSYIGNLHKDTGTVLWDPSTPVFP